MGNKVTEIAGNDVSWWSDDEYKDLDELPEFEIGRIGKLINEGYNQGELHGGWWSIINWKDIACELYNACPNRTPAQKKARKRFDENWN